MSKPLPVLFWFELALSVLSAISFILTVMRPQWIETFFGFEPDGGDGSSEWGITLSLFVATIILAALTRRTWRRARGVSGI